MANFSATYNFAFPSNAELSNYTPAGWTIIAGVQYAFTGGALGAN